MKYPRRRSPKEILGYSLKIGLFVAAFLVLYKPFGLNELTGKYRNLIIAGYGLPCMLPMVAQGFSKQWLLNRFSFTERWTVGHELLLTLPMLLLIGLCNSIYTILVSRTALSGGVILQMELYTGIHWNLSLFRSHCTGNDPTGKNEPDTGPGNE